jgi:polyhydroxyalkanoate synthesis repressor PhaR
LGVLSDTSNGAQSPVIIKKYANRRLYNTQTSSYVTLDHLCEMVKSGTDFEVRDARTGEDITRSVLAQIIFEEENKGQHLLPIQFLRQLIRFYGDSLQAFLPSYLEMSIDSFTKNQDDMRKKFADAFGTRFQGMGMGMGKDFESLTRQNIAMFERAMRMFSPFGGAMNPEKDQAPSASGARDEEIKDLKDQLAAMRQQIADLAKKS